MSMTVMPRALIALTLGLLALGPTLLSQSPATPPAPAMRGYTPARARAQHDIERAFQQLPSAQRITEWHRYFTSEPHPATSPRTKAIAERIAQAWREQGIEDVTIRRYDVLSSNPRDVRVEMVSPRRYVPSLKEDAYREDPDTSHKDISRSWLSFSASGDVTAPVVYANSGNPEDYDRLRAAGIDPRGKIVIVRYSNPYSYRGFKALTAQREGAAGIIVYSDPMEDGFTKGEVFPKGPWGPDSHFQRGGIAYDYIVPGDPLTPGWASTPGAHRIAKEEAVSVPTIMGVPLSWRDAKPILEALGGPPAPREWHGALPIEYRLGGEARVHLKIDMRTDIQPNYVVEGRIRGSERPDEWITLGNHHDAWVFGGVDPSSGTATMMELTRSVGEMARRGQRPRRTIVFCAWDGEEVTLTGSTEWGEHFAAELKKKLVAYLNVDSSASGPRFSASAVGSLAPLLVDVARDLRDPSGVSLYDAMRTPADAAQGPKEGLLPEQALVRTRIGSGSDHTVFLNYLSRPVVDMTFDGPYGVYHSAYDNHYWIANIGDPGFKYHTLMAQLWGTLALRLANADVLPYAMDTYAASVREFVRELEGLKQVEGNLDRAPLVEGARALRAAARRLDHRLERALEAGTFTAEAADRLNQDLLAFENNWSHPAGIPGRPWFKHLLYAPRYTYAAMTLPGVTEAAERGDWAAAREQAALVQSALAANTALLDAAANRVAPVTSSQTLEERLRAIRNRVDGRMAVYVEHLGTGDRIAIDADAEYETFSVIKVPIMATVLDQARQGKLSLDQRVPMRADQRRIPSGVLYALDPGLQPTVRDLLTLMTIISDNQATDALTDLVGRDTVSAHMASLGLSRTKIRFSDLDWDRQWLSALDPSWKGASGDKSVTFPFDKYPAAQVSEAFRHVIEDTGLYFGRSTAREIGQLFAKIAKGELVSKDASALMIDILKKQQVNDRLPRYLGDGIEIAHKTGDGQPWVANDAGIMWVRGQPIVIVVLAGHHRGSAEELRIAEGRIAATVAHHYGGVVEPAGLEK
jgi:N-acetylated-alpha-linked acidic dipeptidase